MIAVRGPAQEESTIGLVHEDLEHPGHIPAVGDVGKKTRIEDLGLILVHGSRSTPIRPAGFGVLVVVEGREVNGRVQEAEDEIISGPVDDEIQGHVVGVDSYFIRIGPKVGGPLVAKEATHAGEARKTHSGGA